MWRRQLLSALLLSCTVAASRRGQRHRQKAEVPLHTSLPVAVISTEAPKLKGRIDGTLLHPSVAFARVPAVREGQLGSRVVGLPQSKVAAGIGWRRLAVLVSHLEAIRFVSEHGIAHGNASALEEDPAALVLQDDASAFFAKWWAGISLDAFVRAAPRDWQCLQLALAPDYSGYQLLDRTALSTPPASVFARWSGSALDQRRVTASPGIAGYAVRLSFARYLVRAFWDASSGKWNFLKYFSEAGGEAGVIDMGLVDV